MKILVTGGAGYLGSIMVPRLLEGGHQVTVLDSFMYRQAPLLDWCIEPRLTVVRGDARDRDAVRELLGRHDAVIPLAAIVGARACDRDPVAATTVNLDAVRMLLELVSPGQLMVFPCTNSGYGIGQEGISCTEDTPLRPVSLYGRLKVDAEKLLLDSGCAVTLRLATVFGMSPRMRLDLLVNDLTHKAWRDRYIAVFEPHFKRNYIHVRDVARAFEFALDHYDAMKGRPYNVGLSDANLSKLELCERIRWFVPHCDIFVSEAGSDPDRRNYIVSNERIERLGFKPQHSLDAGIRELIKGYEFLPDGQYGNA